MKILKRIGLICCAVLLGIGAIFLPRTAKSQSYIAKADSDVVTYNLNFNGSNMNIPIYRQTNQNIIDYLVAGVNFSIYSDKIDVYFNTQSGGYGYWFLNRMDGSLNFATLFLSTSQFTNNSISSVFTGSLTGQAVVYNVGYYYWNDSSTFGFAFNGSANLLNDVNGCQTGFITTTFSNFSYPCNYIRYFDMDGNYLTFYFRTLNQPGSSVFQDRIYYFSSALDLDESQQFNAGYQEGLQANQDNIYNQGRTDGFNGGYNQGYQEGVEAASNNNFFTLIGAAVDVPITALTSLLNFTFLGVNLLAFVTSILTLALIIFVIKKFMGKG